MQNKFSTYRILLTVLVLSMLYACSIKKYIPENEMLFRGGKVKVIDTLKIKNKSGLEKELGKLLYPEPNKRFLGIYYGAYFHFKAAKKDKPGFVTRFLNKKLGEKPVYFSAVSVEDTEDLIENRLQNSGFFYSNISSKVKKDSSAKTVKTNYKVVIGKPYVLKNYVLEVDSVEQIDSFPVYQEIRNSFEKTILKKGSRYDLGAFKA